MNSPRNQLIVLFEQGAIPAERMADALVATKVAPDGKAWRTFGDHLLLWLGGLALAFAAMFFIAYNWADLGRFGKFGLIEVLVVLAVLAYWRFAEHGVAGKVSLCVATILLGVLLALYGQTYQTGADPWHLFFNWALLSLPWVLIARFPALWVFWLALVNLSVALYQQTSGGVFGLTFSHDEGLPWLMFLINTLSLVVWELLARTWRWLNERWAPRFLAVAGALPLTWLVWYGIFDNSETLVLAGSVWVIWLVGLYLVYRKRQPDLFMLAGGCLSGIVILISLPIEYLFEDLSASTMLFLALLVIGLGTGAAVWLRNVQEEWQS